jgi:hypothetical protein
VAYLPPPPSRRRGRARRRALSPLIGAIAPPGLPYLAASGSTGGTPTTRTATVTKATAAGDTLLVQISLGAAGFTVGACTDTAGNTYTLDLFYSTTSPYVAWYRAEGKTGGPGGNVPTVPLNPGDTISITTSATSGTCVTTMLDVPGCSFDTVGAPVSPSGATTLSASVTPSGAGETIIYASAMQATASSIFVNSPFVFAESSQPGGGVWHSWAYDQGAGTGVQTGTTNWTGAVNARGICYALIPGGTPPSLPYVQAAVPVHITSLTGPVNLTFARPTGAGNTVVVFASSNGSTGNPSVSGCTLGGSADNFAKASALNSATRNDSEIWYDPGAAAGQTAIAVNWTGGSGTGDLFVEAYELPGILALDQVGTGEGGAGTTFTASTPTTTQAAEFFCACQIVTGSRTSTPTGTGTWLGNQLNLAPTYNQISSIQQVASTQAATYSGTLSGSSNFTAAVATFYTVPATASPALADQAAAADAISVAVPTAKMATLADTFPGAAIGSQWTSFGTATVQGGSVALTDTATTANPGVLQSAAAYDLTASQFAVRLLSAGAQQANTMAILKVQADPNNSVQMLVQNGTLACQHQVAGSFSAFLASVSYSAATHKWLRIREAAGTLYYEWSTDGSSWTTLYSEADPITLTSLTVTLQEYNGATDPIATSQWTDVNSAATPYQSATGLTTGAGASRTATVATPTAAGDTLLALVTTQNTSCTISSFTDARGNVYTLDTQAQVAVPMCAWFRSPGATGGPGGGPTAALQIGDVATATTAASTGNCEILLTAVPGVGAVDIITSVGNGTNGSPTRAFTPRADSEMCVALLADSNTGGQATVSAPFTALTTYHTGVNPYSTAAWEQLGTGTNGVAQSFNATITPIQWYVVVYTFYPAGTTPALADAAGAADQLSVSATVVLADTGAASEAPAISATVPLPDVAAAADATTVAAAVPLTDVGAGAYAQVTGPYNFTQTVAAPLADVGSAADSVATPARTLPLADTAAAAETSQASATVPLADTAAGSDVASQSAAIPLADQAASADQVAVTSTQPVALADAAGAAETFTVQVAVPLAEQGAAADAATTPARTLPLTDAAGAADAPVIAGTVPLSESAAAADAISVAETTSLADQAGAADQQAVQAAVPLADPGSAADQIAVTAAVPLAEQAGAADALAVPQRTSPLPDAGGAADQVTAAVTSPAADAAGAADAITVQQGIFITLLDAAGAADAPTVGAAVPVADQAAAADAQGIGMPVALADTGAAADATVTAAQVPVSDTAAGADQVSAAAAVPLADPAAAADAVGTVAGAAPALNDVAGAAEQISSPASVPLAEAAGAAESLSVIVGALATQADAAGATDSLSVSVQVALPDAAGAADGLAVAQAASVGLPDAAGVTDALSASVAAPGHDVAAASDSIVVVPALQRAVSDSAAAADSLVVTVPSIAPEPAWRCGALAQQWSCAIALARLVVAAAAARWETEPSPPRWAVRMLAARWEAIMAEFKPIASISKANINVVWTSDLGGTDVDPTAQPMPVKFAFPVSSGDENAPAQPATWFDGVWLDPAGRQKGWIAQCPVGPTSLGGLLQLARGSRYDVWSEVDTGTETVREFVGVQAVY